MRLRSSAILLGAMLSGCAFKITTPDVTVNPPPPSAPILAVGVVASGIDVAEAESPGKYSDFRSDLYSALTSESGGRVAALTNQPLHLLASLRFKAVSTPPSAFIGVLSLYLPPLAFIPESNSEDYSVTYSIRDRAERILYSRTLAGKVEGYIKGYFVGRIEAQKNLKNAEGPFVAKNAARLVLQDMFEHSQAIADAARNLAKEAASKPEAETAPGTPAPATGGEWWQK